MKTRISSQHHSVAQPRARGRFVKQRTNGHNKIEGATVATPLGAMQRIVRPQARYNWLMPNIGAITPQFIEMTLNGAMAGNHVQQWSLFDLMLRTWPELRSCYTELVTSVLRKTIVFEPYCEEDEQPTPDAIERSKLVSTALRRMEPDSQNDGNDFEGTIKDILDAWFRGYAVSEVVWNTIDDKQVGMITAPRTSFWVDPCNYAFDTYNSIGLLPQRQSQGGSFPPFANTALQLTQREKLIPFPENRFLVGICKSKSGSPLAGAMLVPLAWWWCAANFSSDWLLNYAQIFGIPFRWATWPTGAPQQVIDDVCNLLQNMGANAWWGGPEGTVLNVEQSKGTGSDHTPQGELLDRADRYCRTLILGQTMTGTHGTTGKGGGQAFGKVEEDVKADRIDAAGKFAMSVINRQLIPSILALNYGDTYEAPSAKFLEDEVADLTEAQRDKTLVDAGLPIGVDYARKKYDIPAPAEGEETLSKPEPASPFGGQGLGGQGFGGDPQNTDETKSPTEENDPAKASDQTGHPFRGNQYVKVKVGDTVHYTEPSIAYKDGKPITVQNKRVGRVVFIRPDGKIEIKSQSGGYKIVHPSELGFTPTAKPKSTGIELQRGTGGRLATTEGAKRVATAKQAFRDAINKTDYASPSARADAIDFHRANVEQVISDAHNEAANRLHNKKPFPSLLPSEEEKRRLMRNAGLQTKLEQLNEIENDAIFAAELLKLAGEIK